MKRLAAVLGLGVMALAACSEGISPDGGGNGSLNGAVSGGRTLSSQEAAPVLAVVDQSGWSGTDFGAVGAVTEFVNDGEVWASAPAPYASAAGVVTVPEFWGRLRGEPVLKTRSVVEQGDTAWASIQVDYNGAFLVDLDKGDGKLLVTSKPLVESMVQQARLHKGPQNDKGYHNWVLVGITPQQYLATDEAKRTVKITQVTVSVNGVVKLDITDPTAFARICQGTETTRCVPLFTRGDNVRVLVKVENTTGTNNTPPTFAFLSSFHADPNGLGWRRMVMHDNGDGSYGLSWVAQQRGKERIIVEALDAQSFATPTGDDYRANVWAIPYQIQ